MKIIPEKRLYNRKMKYNMKFYRIIKISSIYFISQDNCHFIFWFSCYLKISLECHINIARTGRTRDKKVSHSTGFKTHSKAKSIKLSKKPLVDLFFLLKIIWYI